LNSWGAYVTILPLIRGVNNDKLSFNQL
jgi:hypothetical protein